MKPTPEKKDRKVFEINLRGLDIDQFKKNPIVINNGDTSSQPVGVAQYITKDTVAICFLNQVFIDFIDNVKISTAYIQDEKGKKILVHLNARIAT